MASGGQCFLRFDLALDAFFPFLFWLPMYETPNNRLFLLCLGCCGRHINHPLSLRYIFFFALLDHGLSSIMFWFSILIFPCI
ncbi:uncharacterized protein B0H64DRAFT_12076 [Chaetomium fimeti]|uniref:Uncharacterized protein n=1 Tax=Chaetomium fimeti TaxID=1854472 RepID=A0AAE0HPD8_9PEZI|nr:hypothetical protein B0H64DRAFT_12076 [Chaetomium fimeti]